MAHGRVHPNYVVVWWWLVGLVLASVLVSAFLPVPQPLIVGLIFAAAAVKAVLVALYYMHPRCERLLIYSLVLVPLAFLAVLLLVLPPDIAWH